MADVRLTGRREYETMRSMISYTKAAMERRMKVRVQLRL
jgi:hypothetical protein